MKQQVIFRIGLLSVPVLVILVLLSGMLKTNTPAGNQKEQQRVYISDEADTLTIAAEDLPASVKNVIQTDSLINDLKITAVRKISQKNDNYYDVWFLDSDNFNIMVVYNKDGMIINQ
ncbi:hypothetical protein SAMN05192553_11188 [Cyclobacterium xiamenense]|uniref:Beta-lactamase-inhibitor-like, PepSY-like n=1 Tax=Cyclobacterium xiamenense TaxID=1297121 RepID=A0A1H7BHF4_9BACT|nr:hypothetical protein [Cyclobacterium xiamenense]SEJ75747.1 hypothetical protein SAMN05192553_11188 [Cyclobacterium xiamenense]